jgi:hypothetical protein
VGDVDPARPRRPGEVEGQIDARIVTITLGISRSDGHRLAIEAPRAHVADQLEAESHLHPFRPVVLVYPSDSQRKLARGAPCRLHAELVVRKGP